MKSLFLVVALFAFAAFPQEASDASVVVSPTVAPAVVPAAPAPAPVVDAGLITVTVTPTTPVVVMATDGGIASVVVMDADGGVSITEVPGMSTAFSDIYQGVKSGNWWLVLAAFVVLVVGILKTYGKKLHAWIPATSPLNLPLWFIFDTKPGSWLLNWLTAIAAVLGTAMASGAPVNFTVWKTVVMVSTTGTALFELVDDIVEWIKTKKAPPIDPASPAVAVK